MLCRWEENGAQGSAHRVRLRQACRRLASSGQHGLEAGCLCSRRARRRVCSHALTSPFLSGRLKARMSACGFDLGVQG